MFVESHTIVNRLQPIKSPGGSDNFSVWCREVRASGENLHHLESCLSSHSTEHTSMSHCEFHSQTEADVLWHWLITRKGKKFKTYTSEKSF